MSFVKNVLAHDKATHLEFHFTKIGVLLVNSKFSASITDKNLIMKYFVNQNAQATGEHEVHSENCFWLSLVTNKLYLGDFSSCAEAVRAARKYYLNVDGCIHCCRECHRR